MYRAGGADRTTTLSITDTVNDDNRTADRSEAVQVQDRTRAVQYCE